MGGHRADGDGVANLKLTIAEIERKTQDDDSGEINNLSPYHRDLLKWHRNVDKRYAWVILVALWLAMAANLGPYRIYGLIFGKVTNEGIYTRAEASWPIAMVFTCANIASPLISIIAYHLSYRQCFFVGGLMVTLGNGLTALSDSLIMDTILIGLVTGIGGSFQLIPLLGIINSYFLARRTIAMGVCLCGGTVATIIMLPIFEWLLEHYPWRYSYVGLGLVSSITLFVAPLLRPNPRPAAGDSSSYGGGREHPKAAPIDEDGAATQQVGARGNVQDYNNNNDDDKGGEKAAIAIMPLMWAILKTPVFYIICYQKFTYFWIFSIYSMVLVDNAIDRGNTKAAANFLLNFESIGEMLGRVVLSFLVDVLQANYRLSTNRTAIIVVYLSLAGCLCLITQVSTFAGLASLTVFIFALTSLLYVLINGLIVDYLGESKVTLCYGMASFAAGLLLTLRPMAVHFFRDTLGSYDLLMVSMGVACVIGGLLWMVEPLISPRKCSSTRADNDDQGTAPVVVKAQELYRKFSSRKNSSALG